MVTTSDLYDSIEVGFDPEGGERRRKERYKRKREVERKERRAKRRAKFVERLWQFIIAALAAIVGGIVLILLNQ